MQLSKHNYHNSSMVEVLPRGDYFGASAIVACPPGTSRRTIQCVS